MSDTGGGDSQDELIPGVKNEKPIYFLSHKLSPTQERWSTVEKEAFAIHYALQKLDHYLHNAEFVIKTDHNPLKYILESMMQNRKVQGWALGIAAIIAEWTIYLVLRTLARIFSRDCPWAVGMMR
jgi:hypothetical protein